MCTTSTRCHGGHYQFATLPATVIRRGRHPPRRLVHRFRTRPALLRAGQPGQVRAAPAPAGLSGPAADTSEEFNLNGIQATANGKTLIVAHSANGQLYTVDPRTGSATIAGVSVPNVDGIAPGSAAVGGAEHQPGDQDPAGSDLGSGVVDKVITSPLFQTPATAARFGSAWRWSTPSSTPASHHRRPVRDRPRQSVIESATQRPGTPWSPAEAGH